MNYREKADELFSFALKQPCASADWQKHSEDVARVCNKIAEKAGMDPDLAYAKGLLHDVYKSIERDSDKTVMVNGRMGQIITHPFDGYRFLMEKDFPEAARAALTHTFYNLEELEKGGFDGRLRPDDKKLLQQWLSENEYDEYDKLVQLADNMTSWKGIMTVNDRFCDILIRHPVAKPYEGLKSLYEIKDYFDEKVEGNIYEFFREEIAESAITEPTRKSSVGQNPGQKVKMKEEL